MQEGGGENPYRHVNKLKSLVNVEFRAVNPKFGRQYREHNACRWLVFSNHENALPLNDTDRRWRVVNHKAAPRPPADYAQLYALLDDAAFINAVGVFLRERNISGFNPGERPPMNDAKRAAISASKSLVQQDADGLVAGWPADVITSGDAANVLSDGRESAFTPAMRRAMTGANAVQYTDAGGRPRQIKVCGAPVRCWILRNRDRWEVEAPYAVAAEIMRARGSDGTLSAMDVLAGSSGTAMEDDPPF